MYFGNAAHETIFMTEKNSFLLNQNPKILKTNLILFKQIKNLYIKYEIWTYYRDYLPPIYDIFYESVKQEIIQDYLSRPLILNYIGIPEGIKSPKRLLPIFGCRVIFLISFFLNLFGILFGFLKLK